MYTIYFIILPCLLSVFGRVGGISLVDLVKQSAVKLNPHFEKASLLTGSETKRQPSVIQTPSMVASRQHDIQQTGPSPQTGRRTSHADPISVLPEKKPLGSDVKGGQASEIAAPAASIQQAVDLVLQYIQLTPKFGINSIGEKGLDATAANPAAKSESTDRTTPVGSNHKAAFVNPQKSTPWSTKEKLSPEQQLGLLLSVADEIKKIGTPSSDITLQDAIKLLMELAPNASLPLKVPLLPLEQIQQIMQPQVTKTDSTCRGPCPPKWINILDFFSHLLSPGSEMCHIYQTMELQSCDTPNTSCKPGYTCCSSTCVDNIVVCDPWYPHKVPGHICLPNDVSSWWPDVHKKLPHIIGHGSTHRDSGSSKRSTNPT